MATTTKKKTSSASTSASTSASSASTFTRKFKGEEKVMHDLYKLEVASAIKNIAWAPNQFEPQKVEHCHFYHSVDKNGRPNTTSAPIMNHFHVMEKIEDGVYKCSRAKKWVRDATTGAKKMVDIPHDDHTHNVVYINSHEFVQQKLNPETVKLMGEVDKKPEPVPGIVG